MLSWLITESLSSAGNMVVRTIDSRPIGRSSRAADYTPAYLLLNSLPFVDLDDQITFDGKSILTSSLFREVSSTHFIPYHLLLKWGSIYHRYKTHLIDGYDILNGCINPSYVSNPLTGKTLFDNNILKFQ